MLFLIKNPFNHQTTNNIEIAEIKTTKRIMKKEKLLSCRNRYGKKKTNGEQIIHKSSITNPN